jgi:hypothetical protein
MAAATATATVVALVAFPASHHSSGRGLAPLSGGVSGPAQGPRIRFERSELDLGAAEYGAEITTKVSFSNAGSELLRVKDLRSSCTCTVGTLEKKEYQPGEAGQIELKYRALRMPGEEVRQSLLVETNDPTQPLSRVVVKSTMKPSLAIIPREVNLGAIRPGEAPRVKLTVASVGELGAFRIEAVEADLGAKDVQVSDLKSRARTAAATPEDVDAPLHTIGGSAYEVHLTLPPRPTTGPVSGQITVRTTSEESPIIRVPVSGNVVSDFRVDPPTILFSPATPGPKTLRLSSHAGGTERVRVRVLDAGPYLDCDVTQGSSPTTWTLRCSARELPKSRETGVVSLAVEGHPHETRVSVPYTLLPQ